MCSTTSSWYSESCSSLWWLRFPMRLDWEQWRPSGIKCCSDGCWWQDKKERWEQTWSEFVVTTIPTCFHKSKCQLRLGLPLSLDTKSRPQQPRTSTDEETFQWWWIEICLVKLLGTKSQLQKSKTTQLPVKYQSIKVRRMLYEIKAYIDIS